VHGIVVFGLCVGVFLGVPRLRSATVHTLDGHRYQGVITFGNNVLNVALGDTNTAQVPLTNLLAAVLNSAGPETSLLGPLTGGWTSRDVGDVTIAGRAGQLNDTFAIKGAAAANEKKADGFHLIYRSVVGDGEILARVTAVQGADLQARAFVTVRESLAAEGPYALLGVSAGGRLCFQARSEWGTKARTQVLEDVGIPHWLRLVRKDKQFMAYHSSNGRDWRPAGGTNTSLGDSIHIGMAVSSPGRFALAQATFDHVRLTVNGLQGEYFANEGFKTLKLTRVDPRVDFWWGGGTPGESVPEDHFSARWTGQAEPRYSEAYSFHLDAENAQQDAARLWVNGQLAASVPSRQQPENAAPMPLPILLQAGRRYDLKLEYQHGEGSASVRLGWSSRNQSREVIPHSRLLCSPQLAGPGGGDPPQSEGSRLISAKGLLLSTGSFAAGPVVSVDESIVKFSFQGEREMAVPTRQVAAVFLRVPRRPPSLDRVRTGVLLSNGDMFEGEFQKMDGRNVKVSSVLFGIRSFWLDDVAAIFLRPAGAAPGAYAVRTAEGSVLQVRSLGLAPDKVVCEEEVLGLMGLSPDSLVELRRAGTSEGATP
jgi:hypothetical protein